MENRTEEREWMQRTVQLLGTDKTERMQRAHVLVVGLGGVGAYAAEMLVRAGVGRFTLMDADTVQPTNINRQLCALHSTTGRSKVEVLADRFRDINPEVELCVRRTYLQAEDVPALLQEGAFDFVVDAIDTTAPKCALVAGALKHRIPLVCSMGAGAKTDITQIAFSDLWATYHCGLSKAVRNRLKGMGLKGRPVPVVFCTQQADPSAVVPVDGERNKKSTTGTVSYMPAVFGCYLAHYVIAHL